MTNSFNYIMQNGISLYKNYKYTGKKGRCNKTNAPKFMIANYMNIDSNENALTQAIALKGPISVGIDASLSSFQFYNGGVYSDSACSSFNLDHAVLAVGYSTDFSGATPKDYYLVKNSWGPNWGEEGYIRMSRNNKNNCGIATLASFPI
jgi:cathepsin L